MLVTLAFALACSAQHSFPPPVAQTVVLRNPAPGLFIQGEETWIELDPIPTGTRWNEAVPSWNIANAENASLKVEARVLYPDYATRYYSFGTWTLDAAMGRRGSLAKDSDDDAKVLTDTLRTTDKGGMLQFRLTARAWPTGAVPSLKLLAVSFSERGAKALTTEHQQVWGARPLEPPQRAQGDYPNGKVLCSPASLSMVLGYWANQLKRPAMDRSVPQVESCVFDAVYGGAGNWSYNVAYAGSLPSMEAYVSRMNGIIDLEMKIESGVPVICSVSWYLLHGEPLKDDEQGHLVVLVGFTKDGDPIFNDPGDRIQVRKTYKRADFAAAWDYSGRTAYVIRHVPPAQYQGSSARA